MRVLGDLEGALLLAQARELRGDGLWGDQGRCEGRSGSDGHPVGKRRDAENTPLGIAPPLSSGPWLPDARPWRRGRPRAARSGAPAARRAAAVRPSVGRPRVGIGAGGLEGE